MGAQSTTITVSANPTVITAPSALSGSAGRGYKATLRWTDNAGNEEGFRIERAPSGSTSFVEVGQVGANVATFAETVSRGSFVYRVRAFSASLGVYSGYSNPVTVKLAK